MLKTGQRPQSAPGPVGGATAEATAPEPDTVFEGT